MYVNYCTDTGEWTVRDQSCDKDVSCPCDGTDCFAFVVESHRDAQIVLKLIEALHTTYWALLDGDNPMPNLARVFKEVTGRDID